jgi:hypothetical protein
MGEWIGCGVILITILTITTKAALASLWDPKRPAKPALQGRFGHPREKRAFHD